METISDILKRHNIGSKTTQFSRLALDLHEYVERRISSIQPEQVPTKPNIHCYYFGGRGCNNTNLDVKIDSP